MGAGADCFLQSAPAPPLSLTAQTKNFNKLRNNFFYIIHNNCNSGNIFRFKRLT